MLLVTCRYDGEGAGRGLGANGVVGPAQEGAIVQVAFGGITCYGREIL